MLTIFRGDDLAFAEFDRKVCVRFDTIQDLTGWSANFCLLDNIKRTDNISSRIWTFGYTSEETALFPLGKTFGKLTIIDSKGQIRQMSRVEVEVVNKKMEPCIAGNIAISIDTVLGDYSQLLNKPVINGVTVEGEHDGTYYGLADAAAIEHIAEQVEVLSQDVARIDQTTQETAQAVATLSSDFQNLSQSVDERITTIQGDVADVAGNLEALVDGQYLVSQMLFEAEGDPDNFYRVRVVMRDAGDGRKLPTFALVAVPKDGNN